MDSDVPPFDADRPEPAAGVAPRSPENVGGELEAADGVDFDITIGPCGDDGAIPVAYEFANGEDCDKYHRLIRERAIAAVVRTALALGVTEPSISPAAHDDARAVDPNALAVAVAECVIWRLVEQHVRLIPEITGAPPHVAPQKFIKIAEYARRTGYSTRTIETFISEGLPTVGARRLRRVDVEPADEWIRNRATLERDDQDSVEREARDDARRGRSARRRGRT
jgi:hypothetical protein